jgi:hypothetical protein
MANGVQTCAIRFLENNLLLDTTNVSYTSDVDYDGKDISDVLDPHNFGVYRLTKNATEDGYLIDVTLSAPLEVTSFAMVANDVNGFYLTNESEVKIQASNFGFDMIEKEIIGRHSRFGVFANLSEVGEQNAFKYWRILITEGNRDVSENNETLDIKYCFFGDGVELTERNIAGGISVGVDDLSQVFKAESGREYYNQKDKQMKIGGLRFQYMNDTDRANFQKFYYEFGTTNNFLTMVDPDGKFEAEPCELMRVMKFDKLPTQTHRIRDLFENTFSLTEAL